MKTQDVETLNQVLLRLRENGPIEQELLDSFSVAVSNCTAALERQKSRYQEKAPYHRQKTREWAREHPEKVRQYRQDHKKKKGIDTNGKKKGIVSSDRCEDDADGERV